MMNYLKKTDVRALLGRDEVLGDGAAALAPLADCSVLVTGAGTLGTAICDALAGQVRELHCCDHSEAALCALREAFPAGVAGHLCSVASRSQVDGLLDAARPNVVIHTAAHKHVGPIEAMPRAGVQNNVGSLVAMLEATLDRDARFLLISTDKAVAPSCVYGATKHICERLTYGAGAGVLRLVNLLGSSGSVLPIFWERMARRQPLLVTHPEVERHFITVREAAWGAIRAAAMAPRMRLSTTSCFPPVRIADLARRAAQWTGVETTIEFGSLSPVEKLSEVPLYADEVMTDTGSLFCCMNPHPLPLRTIDAAYEALLQAVDSKDGNGALDAALRALVPDYQEPTL